MDINFTLENEGHEDTCKRLKLRTLRNSIQQDFVFPECTLNNFEINIDEIVKKGKNGQLKEDTVDCTPLRNKYFFGERYTYGENGLGSERLYPKDAVDPIPEWITNNLIEPLIAAEILPEKFVNCVVINDYQPGGCIVSHIDPPQIFDRPIVSISLFSNSALCFGCKFHYKPLRCSKPLLKLEMPRGVVTSLSGFAANEITHCVRPEDVTQRRAVIMLRRVHHGAPRLLPNSILTLNKILNPVVSLDLKVEDFVKLRQTLLKWQNEGVTIGRVAKRVTKKKKYFTRYTSEFYKII